MTATGNAPHRARLPLRLRTRGLVATTAALLLLTAAGPAAAARDTETVERSFRLQPGATVSVSNTNGNVHIGSWDGDTVRVEAVKEASALSASRTKELLEETRIRFAETADGLEISTDMPDGRWLDWIGGGTSSVEYEIRLPAGIGASARTVNGNVVAEGVRDGVEARSTNGRIVIRESGGRATARTTNGSVKVELTSLDGDVDLSSTNGSISITLPAGVDADVEARTTNGSVRNRADLVVTDTNRRGTRLEGRLGAGGGPRIELRTVNGSITVSD